LSKVQVLTQIEVLIALRLVSPQDRKAIEAWTEVHGTPEQRDTLMESLASLPIGTAWVSSPGWLNMFQKVKIRQRETFDSSATPKTGELRRVPSSLAKVDLTRLRERIIATLEQSNSEDPKQLRQHITRLENQLRDTIASKTMANEQIERLENTAQCLKETGTQLITIAQELSAALTSVPLQKQKPHPKEVNHALGAHVDHQESEAPSEKKISAAQQRIVDALAALKNLGLEDVDRSNIAVFADQSPKSSGFINNLGSLRSQGFIDYPSGGRVALTESGQVLAKVTAPIHGVDQLHAAWYKKLSKPQARILQALIKHYPHAIERTALAEITEQSARSSGYTNNLGTLRSLGIIDYPKPGQVTATKILFPAIRKQEPRTSRGKQ
jgi:hypothetical protein